MANSNEMALPEGYKQLQGSERHPSKYAKLLGPADEKETLKVIVVLRRRKDGPTVPDMDSFMQTPRGKRKRYSRDEFTENFGAHPDDLDTIVKFAEKSGLSIIETNPAARTVKISGTVAQMNQAFSVELGYYEHTKRHASRKNPQSHSEKYRGHEGFVHVPKDLADIVVGVIGLDNPTIAKHSSSNYPNNIDVDSVSVNALAQLYNFPENQNAPSYQIQQAQNQTIGIVSFGTGFLQSDLDTYFSSQYQGQIPALSNPTPLVISADGIANNIAVQAFTNAIAPVNSSVLTFNYSTELYNALFNYQAAGATVNVQTNNTNTATYLQNGTTVASATFTATTITVNLSLPVQAAVDATIPVFFNMDGECTLDISIAGAAAPGAKIVLYIAENNPYGFYSLFQEAIYPASGGATLCSVLSSSWTWSSDDPGSLNEFQPNLNTILTAFQDAAILGDITVCVCTGDEGSNDGVTTSTPVPGTNPTQYYGDGKAHVGYPTSEPWVLAVGGTAIGNVTYNNGIATSCDEYVWSDIVQSGQLTVSPQWGATGGGVSDNFPLPSYQSKAGVNPVSLNDNQVRRGIPDVAANACLTSGYNGLIFAGTANLIWGGTSCSTPFWAGLVAVLNTALGENVGFMNPFIYQLGNAQFNQGGTKIFNLLAAGGPSSNQTDTLTQGYNVNLNGWDPCKGWGSPDAQALISAFQNENDVFIFGGYQSPDIILADPSGNIVPLGGAPGGAWDTLLQPGVKYTLSANIHNDSDAVAYINAVSFWAVPGGVGTSGGTCLDTYQPATPRQIPPNSYITVQSSQPFVNPGSHMCAAVSIYSTSSGYLFNGATDPNSQDIPDPGLDFSHSSSAWRNTDSISGSGGSGFRFKLGFGALRVRLQRPVALQIKTTHIPNTWGRIPRIREMRSILEKSGAVPNIPLYLLPEFMKTFSAIDLNNRLSAAKGATIEKADREVWHIMPNEHENTVFEIDGTIPENVKKGDVIVVNVTAAFPEMDNRPAREVGFMEFIHITK